MASDPAMWCYGSLTTVTFSDFAMSGPRKTQTVAFLTDSGGTSVIAKWPPGDGRDLFAAMDILGADGWIIGGSQYSNFGSQYELGHPSMPRFIRLALEDVTGLPPKSIGYTTYPLRRPAGYRLPDLARDHDRAEKPTPS